MIILKALKWGCLVVGIFLLGIAAFNSSGQVGEKLAIESERSAGRWVPDLEDPKPLVDVCVFWGLNFMGGWIFFLLVARGLTNLEKTERNDLLGHIPFNNQWWRKGV